MGSSRGLAVVGIPLVCALLFAAPCTVVFAEPATFDDVAAAESKASALQDEIAELEAEQRAIETRIDVTNARLIRQRDVVEQALAEVEAARTALRAKLVAMYKARRPDPVSLLLEADSISDLVSRALLLSRIAKADNETLRAAAVTADEAAYQVSLLDDLRTQDVALRQMQESRKERLRSALSEQEDLVSKLTEEARRALAERQAAERRAREEWRDSSIPLDSSITFVGATVEPYVGQIWLVPDFRPRRYRALGGKFAAQCSWYGNEFHGRPTASGQIFNENDFTCASNTYAFGTTLALSRGDRRIIVVVNDRGPFVWSGSSWLPHPVRKLDLSKASAYALGFTGVADVTIEQVAASE